MREPLQRVQRGGYAAWAILMMYGGRKCLASVLWQHGEQGEISTKVGAGGGG